MEITKTTITFNVYEWLVNQKTVLDVIKNELGLFIGERLSGVVTMELSPFGVGTASAIVDGEPSTSSASFAVFKPANPESLADVELAAKANAQANTILSTSITHSLSSGTKEDL